ncbi:hypothetical protein CUMW_275250 [Citrus unshiu]|uniref:Uncharacterized protein n=1 Tax=Citrus unshiu TaxID=55188 RepID=A0A2H5MZQ3_CITUN|nr:hypothetical protein CUMW_275250 [Citrus unshiu]
MRVPAPHWKISIYGQATVVVLLLRLDEKIRPYRFSKQYEEPSRLYWSHLQEISDKQTKIPSTDGCLLFQTRNAKE